MPDDIITKGIPHKELAPILNGIKHRVFDSDVIKDICKKYKIDSDELPFVPICFAKLPVSARTDHGIIYLNVDLFIDKNGVIMDNEQNDHYLPHEFTHFSQQTTGNKATPGSTEDTYLDNPIEQEGFQNQTKYISDTQGEGEAEEYIEQVLDHHTKNNVDDKKRESRKDKLLEFANQFVEILKSN